MHQALKPFASLRLTVALFVAAMVLIFAGTLAQTEHGVWRVVENYFRSAVAWIDLGVFVPGTGASPGPRVPFPGGLLIAGAMIVNLLAAHAVRFKATRKRVGVLVLHAGLIVLLGGEFVTAFLADEGLMRIREGQSAGFVEDVRSVELAVVDPSWPESDRVVSIPGNMILEAAAAGEPIVDPRLPFEVRVERWMPNADIAQSPSGTPDTQGFGRELVAVERPRARGVDGGDTDHPAAIVTVSRDGETLGRWLLSSLFNAHQPVSIDGQTYGIALRFERTYLPYRVKLLDFRHDTFVGTEIARNFSSDVQLFDAEGELDRETRIWMNHPLRYAGRTFYQASYMPDVSGTVLQVVRNPGWLMPYVACALVGGGMLLQFGQSLIGFLRRRAAHGKPNAAGSSRPPVGVRGWALRGGVLGLGLLLALNGLIRNPGGATDGLDDFARLPVSAGGRVKPMDTAARNLLMVAGGKQSAEGPRGEVDALSYFLELVAKPGGVEDLDAVRVDHPDVLALLGLSPDEGGRVGLGAIRPHWREIAHRARHADATPPAERDAFDRSVLDLHRRVNAVLSHAQLRRPYVVPPLNGDETWRPFRQALPSDRSARPHPSVAFYTSMMDAWHERDARRFENAAEMYQQLLRRDMPGVMRRMDLEVLFNRASPFTGATAVYLLALLTLCGSFLARGVGQAGSGGRWPERLRVSAVVLLVAAAIVHTAAIAVRIYLQDRPPVTNLYSSAVFVGWASVLVGLLLERLYPLGIAALCSGVIGAATLIVAHNLGSDGDTMQMMQAVLDSNFWLATHVITITLGYSATFLAGALGAVFLIAGAATSWLNKPRAATLSRMTYGVVCFALLLSFVGTVLGGIWADQSWGRFWGWDPKENGAALVVLLNAVILHARWGGLVRQRGIAVLAVAGNIVTAWSWFGTNMLGVGLHSYGFMDSAVVWLAAFVALNVFIMGLGLAHRRGGPPTPRLGRAATADEPPSGLPQ